MPLKADVRTTSWDAAAYLADDEDIRAYLSAAFAERDASAIGVAIGAVARAKGMSGVASAAGVSRESLYKALSEAGNPTFATILKVLSALNLRLVVAHENEMLPAAERPILRRRARETNVAGEGKRTTGKGLSTRVSSTTEKRARKSTDA